MVNVASRNLQWFTAILMGINVTERRNSGKYILVVALKSFPVFAYSAIDGNWSFWRSIGERMNYLRSPAKLWKKITENTCDQGQRQIFWDFNPKKWILDFKSHKSQIYFSLLAIDCGNLPHPRVELSRENKIWDELQSAPSLALVIAIVLWAWTSSSLMILPSQRNDPSCQ